MGVHVRVPGLSEQGRRYPWPRQGELWWVVRSLTGCIRWRNTHVQQVVHVVRQANCCSARPIGACRQLDCNDLPATMKVAGSSWHGKDARKAAQVAHLVSRAWSRMLWNCTCC
jgi:hypothetical protein